MKRAALQACALACERGGRRLFEGVEFSLREGDALWLSGGNGSGKTSLLRLLAGLGLPAAGEVRWRGRPVRELREDYHRHLLYCGHAAAIKDDLSAWENVVYGATLAGRPVSRAQAEAALGQVGLEHIVARPAHALSQGQRRRVALARLNLDPLPPLLLLDEPFTALDADAVQALSDRIAAHLAQGGMAVYTTHQAHGLRPARLQRIDLDGRASGEAGEEAGAPGGCDQNGADDGVTAGTGIAAVRCAADWAPACAAASAAKGGADGREGGNEVAAAGAGSPGAWHGQARGRQPDHCVAGAAS